MVGLIILIRKIPKTLTALCMLISWVKQAKQAKLLNFCLVKISPSRPKKLNIP
jgi:hypothetical protein